MPNPDDILFLLHDTARQLRLAADRRAAGYGLTRAQWVILHRLRCQEGLSQKELAELVEVEPITVARLIDRLAERGLVERRADPADRRVWRLHLLPPAVGLLAKLDGERDAILRCATAGFDAETLARVVEALTRIKTSVVNGRAREHAPSPQEAE